MQRVAAYGPARYRVEEGGKVVRFEAERPLGADESFEVRVQFPHGIISPEVPAWQVKEERMKVWALMGIGLIFLVLTSIVAYGVWVWVRKYREPYVLDKPDILKEPPYLDPPGMAGALVEQEVKMRHILATLVDLARRGIITLEEVRAIKKDYVIHYRGGDLVAEKNSEIEERLEYKASVEVNSYEHKLLNAVFEGKPTRRLSELKYKFYTRIPEIEASLWNALVEAGWAVHPPVIERELLSVQFVIGIWGMILCVIIITGLSFEIHIIILLGVVALGLLIVLGRMLEWSYRTPAGAERAARWQAFAKWLKELHEINPAEAKAQLEAYLPYAIAFGIEKEFLARWLAIAPDTPPPSWYRSTSSYGSMRSTSSTSDRFSWGSMENTGGEGRGGGSYSLDSLADSLTKSLNSFASSLSAMLNATASTLSSAPPSRSGSGGGGWSGGGSRGGGGGGGGSSSFD